MTDFIPRDKHTAYQRWEMAAFDEAEQAAERAAEEAARQAATSPVEPEVVPEPVIESVETEAAPVIVLPTAAEIEQMHAVRSVKPQTMKHLSVAVRLMQLTALLMCADRGRLTS